MTESMKTPYPIPKIRYGFTDVHEAPIHFTSCREAVSQFRLTYAYLIEVACKVKSRPRWISQIRLDHGRHLLDLFPVTLLAGCETGDGKGRGGAGSPEGFFQSATSKILDAGGCLDSHWGY